MRIAFVGDICLDTELATWEAAAVPDLHAELGVDVVVGNFESAVDGPEVGSPAPRKICLSAPRGVLPKLKRMGIDFLSVANNHVADYGPRAAVHTIEVLKEEFGDDRVFGWAGRPGAELAPGLSVVAACFRETNPLVLPGETRVFTVEQEAEPGSVCDREGAVILYAHWGEEYVSLTGPLLRARARQLLASGFSQIVGTHSHVVGAGEDIGDGSVVYGLGNFLFRVIPKTNERMLRRNKRGTVVVFDWDGRALRLVEHWRSAFDERFNLTVERARGRLPGGPLERAHLALPEALAGPLYRASLSTRWARLALARIVEGVERPSWKKLRTAAGIIFGGKR